MSVGSSIANVFRRPLGYFSREWSRMAPRERQLVSILGAAVLGVLGVVAGFLTVQSLSEIADSNDAAREALAAIAKHRDEFQDAKARMLAQEVRIGSEPPQLQADLEAAAREAGMPAISETRELPSTPAGKRYMEHSAEVTLRQVNLESLSKFLARLETGRRLIVVNKMNIKRAFADGEKLNVVLTAVTYERVKETRKKTTGPKEKS